MINIGGIPFLHGFAKGNQNVFVGGAGNFTTTGTATAATGFGALAAQTTGSFNTASGLDALFQNTTGSHNAANGYKALFSNTTGSDNTASGRDALENNVTGGLNTALGYLAGPGSGSPGLTNSTALGANAIVSQSNTLVLGHTTAGSPGANSSMSASAPRLRGRSLKPQSARPKPWAQA